MTNILYGKPTSTVFYDNDCTEWWVLERRNSYALVYAPELLRCERIYLTRDGGDRIVEGRNAVSWAKPEGVNLAATGVNVRRFGVAGSRLAVLKTPHIAITSVDRHMDTEFGPRPSVSGAYTQVAYSLVPPSGNLKKAPGADLVANGHPLAGTQRVPNWHTLYLHAEAATALLREAAERKASRHVAVAESLQDDFNKWWKDKVKEFKAFSGMSQAKLREGGVAKFMELKKEVTDRISHAKVSFEGVKSLQLTKYSPLAVGSVYRRLQRIASDWGVDESEKTITLTLKDGSVVVRDLSHDSDYMNESPTKTSLRLLGNFGE